MAYRHDVRFIEEMFPDRVEIAVEDCRRVVRLIGSALPSLERAKRTVVWADRSRHLFDQRLRETDQMFEHLREAYQKTARALADYIVAQREAQRLVTDGVRAENRLEDLIANFVRRQAADVRQAAPMQQWELVRSSPSIIESLARAGLADEFNRVRPDADRLYAQAGGFYDRALRTEAQARAVAVRAIGAARRRLPELRTDAGAARDIIARTPGLRQEFLEAAELDRNARRPGDRLTREYQVVDDWARERFPADSSLFSYYAQRTIQSQEARLLEELQGRHPLGDAVGMWDVKRVESIRALAEAEADRRFPGTDADDDHNDAFRHTYANALLTREFGEDWTRRMTTAHETVYNNEASREAMDLYNNEIGRSIALANPGATNQVLADQVEQAVREGRTVVVGRDHRLDFSDQIEPAATTGPGTLRLPGRPQPTPPPPDAPPH